MNSFVEVFDKVLDYFQSKVNNGELTDVAFNLWIKTLKPLNLDENVAYFNVQSEFQKGIILKNYSTMLSDAFINVLGFPVDIEIIPLEDTQQDDEEEESPIVKRRELEQSFSNAEYDYTFDTFIGGH